MRFLRRIRERLSRPIFSKHGHPRERVGVALMNSRFYPQSKKWRRRIRYLVRLIPYGGSVAYEVQVGPWIVVIYRRHQYGSKMAYNNPGIVGGRIKVWRDQHWGK